MARSDLYRIIGPFFLMKDNELKTQGQYLTRRRAPEERDALPNAMATGTAKTGQQQGSSN